jgi:molybdate transport system regulatory protein
MKDNITYKLTVRLFADEKFFGPGVAALLRRVQEHHSLRAAALSMTMAYSKAWTILKNAEKQLDCKLLTSTTGGKGGGGAVLTADAVRLLDAYDAFCAELQQRGDELFAEKFGFIK